MVPFGVPYKRDPKRDHNFDIHPYRGSGFRVSGLEFRVAKLGMPFVGVFSSIRILVYWSLYWRP